MTIGISKVKRTLDALSQERQAQQYRIHLATQAKQQLDNNIKKINTIRP